MPYPSSVEVIEFWVCTFPFCVEVIVILALCLASCVEVVVLERGVVYSNFVIANSSVEVPFVGGPVWTLWKSFYVKAGT